MKKPHIRANVRKAEKRYKQVGQLYRCLLGIASQPIHPLNIIAKALLLDMPRAWKVSA